MLRKDGYRDLEKFRRTAREQKRRYYGRTTDSQNRKQPWTVHEIEAIMERKKTDRELSQELGRSVKSIQVMRSRTKKMAAGRSDLDGQRV